MTTANRTAEAGTELAELVSRTADLITDVLAREQLMSLRSRTALQEVLRGFQQASTHFTDLPMSEEDWFRSWAHHCGSFSEALSAFMKISEGPYRSDVIPPRGDRALYDARIAWLDELDAMTDAELKRVPGVGAKTVAVVRELLDLYYWRGDDARSRQLWEAILEGLRRTLEWRYLKERDRVLDGIQFAQRVLDTDGAPLADPRAAREAVR